MEDIHSAVLKYNSELQLVGNAMDYHSMAGIVSNCLDRNNLSCTPNNFSFSGLLILGHWAPNHAVDPKNNSSQVSLNVSSVKKKVATVQILNMALSGIERIFNILTANIYAYKEEATTAYALPTKHEQEVSLTVFVKF